MLWASDAANGVLILGLTTAFMFTMMQVWQPMYIGGMMRNRLGARE